MNREIILLPSLLIASGFECLTTADVKFLNNYRRHLDRSKYNLDEIFIATFDDYELGGILNPFNEMGCIQALATRYKHFFSSYPYITRNEIKSTIYSIEYESIITRLTAETVEDLHILKEDHNNDVIESLEAKEFNVKRLKSLQSHLFYHKTVALHLCGFGDVMIDAFNKVLKALNTRF